jgi:hypothetical protein
VHTYILHTRATSSISLTGSAPYPRADRKTGRVVTERNSSGSARLFRLCTVQVIVLVLCRFNVNSISCCPAQLRSLPRTNFFN